MVIILGGACQGKLNYTQQHYAAKSVYRCTTGQSEIDFSTDIINSLHNVVLSQIRCGVDSLDYFGNHLTELKPKIIICDDISCGVVPMDPELRLWRETVGRVLVLLCNKADEVVRVYYGLGTKLK